MTKASILLVCVVSAFTLFLGFLLGARYGESGAYRLVRKQMAVDIKTASERGDSQLLEYVKARYYYYSNRAKVRLRIGEGDFGPVKEELIKGYYPGKDLTTFQYEYEQYKRIPGFSEIE